ncbi:reticulon-4 isoform X3 [Ascaphus truei]|uniref:reticulon-4 isoform X3 n=1 Tax=Ascaphus truei TaxID=8439 RepID=UPI003F5974B7
MADTWKDQSPLVSSSTAEEAAREAGEDAAETQRWLDEDVLDLTGAGAQKPKRWEGMDVLDLTGGTGDPSHPPFTVSFPTRHLEEEEDEEERPSWADSLEPSPEDEEPSSISSAPPRAPAVPSAPAEERPPVPRRAPSGSVDKNLSPLPAASAPLMLSSAVVDLLYWRDIKKTGVVFGASLFLLLSLTVFSIVSVTAYIGLALLSVSISFRIYKGILQAIQKSEEGHPFQSYLESNVAVSEELVQKYCNVTLSHINCTIKELRRLFLVEDLVDSLKFAVLMWVFTYIGALFNGLTLLILALISLFSVPVIYERHQTQIDHYIGLINKSVKDTSAMIVSKIPGLKRKPE